MQRYGQRKKEGGPAQPHAHAGPPSKPGRMPLSRQLCQLGQYPMHPIPQSLLPPGYILQVSVINAPCFMHAAGQLVQVVAGIAHQRHHLLQLRQFQTHHIAVQGHLAQIGFPVLCPQLGHLLLDQRQFLRRDPEVQLHLPFALGGAHRSGSFFLRTGAFFSAERGSCFSWRRTEGRRWRSSLERSSLARMVT